MEVIIEKLKEVEEMARELRVKESVVHVDVERLEPERVPEEQNWLDALRATLGGTMLRPLVVLSLFDGIGGTWAALERLDIPYIGYSSETNPCAVQVVRTRFPSVKHLGNTDDIRRSSIVEDIDLVVAGFPCEDLSGLGKRVGLHGLKSLAFFNTVRILHIFQPKWFLVENVAFMHWIDREEMTKYLNVHPIEVDAQDMSACRRKRYYWTNIPHPTKMPPIRESNENMSDTYLDNAKALEDKVGCIMWNDSIAGGLEPVYDTRTKRLRRMKLSELELVLGYPPQYTDVDFRNIDEDMEKDRTSGKRQRVDTNSNTIRWNLLGNTFSVPVISYMLSSLLSPSTWEMRVEHTFSSKYKETECSVMEPGEVWALFNDFGQPSWYAVILSLSGDRFDVTPIQPRTTSQLSISVIFLQLEPAYLDGEPDSWNPVRGTGLYCKMEDGADAQDSFLAFSHRVCTLEKIGAGFFIYPGKGEIWGIYDHASSRPAFGVYYAFVDEVEIDWSRVRCKKPGREGFVAQCRLMQKTTVRDVFRCTGTVVEYRDLSYFSFRVPYTLKTEAGLFKLEVLKSRKPKMIERVNMYKRQALAEKRRREGANDEDDEAHEAD